MARAYSADLRNRVIQAHQDGVSARAAAQRFDIGVTTAVVWICRFRDRGEHAPRRQGQPRGSRLDPHAAFILKLMDQRKDITLAEIAERLMAERGVRAGLTTVWKWLTRQGMTYKKRRRMPPSSSVPT